MWSQPLELFVVFLWVNCPVRTQKRVTIKNILIYSPTALRRVQITPKTSTNITRYLYSRGPVFTGFLPLTNQLAGFPAPISFRFAYFCHTFPHKSTLKGASRSKYHKGNYLQRAMGVLTTTGKHFLHLLLWFYKLVKVTNNKGNHLQGTMTTFNSSCFKLECKTFFQIYWLMIIWLLHFSFSNIYYYLICPSF